jgi:hypothetical protein
MALGRNDQLPVSNNRSRHRHQHAYATHELTEVRGLR